MRESSKLRDRLRILLILYFFSKEHSHPNRQDCIKLFESEVKIQKIDFLLRYPSYFCYELLQLSKNDRSLDKNKVKEIIQNIFWGREPEIRTQEMQKYFFGAYEDLNNTIAFLSGINFIHFDSRPTIDGRVKNKKYWLTQSACNAIENKLLKIGSVKWYSERCILIKRYFGGFSGTELKAMQYEIDEYKNTVLNEYIKGIEQQTKKLFHQEFKESL